MLFLLIFQLLLKSSLFTWGKGLKTWDLKNNEKITYPHIPIYIHISKNTHMHVCMDMYKDMCIYVCICSYIYLPIYTSIRTPSLPFSIVYFSYLVSGAEAARGAWTPRSCCHRDSSSDQKTTQFIKTYHKKTQERMHRPTSAHKFPKCVPCRKHILILLS